MKIWVAQFYIENNANYHFSYIFQNFISEQITALTSPSSKFISTYAEDFELMFNMSAKGALQDNDIRGPAVYKKDKDVEYTIFLPFNHDGPLDERKRRFGLEHLFIGIFEVLERYEIDTVKLRQEKDRIINTIMSDPKMLASDIF